VSDQAITFLILGVTVAVFIWDRLPVAAVALGVALSLWATGVPVVAVMAFRLRMSPSQLLMPLAFGAHAGSLLALTGLVILRAGGFVPPAVAGLLGAGGMILSGVLTVDQGISRGRGRP
jgi:hypothetical protein